MGNLNHILRAVKTKLLQNQQQGTFDVDTGGEFRAGSGSLSDPSFTFTGDLDTGLASPTADELAVVIGGSEAFSISASSETDNGMTADPETDNENGFITVQIGSAAYEIPLYDA